MISPHHQHDAESLSRIDTGNRGKWLRVDDLIEESGVKKGMTCIDLGCGAGALAIPLAETVGKNGKVYLFADEFTDFNESDIGIKTILLLEKLGYIAV